MRHIVWDIIRVAAFFQLSVHHDKPFMRKKRFIMADILPGVSDPEKRAIISPHMAGIVKDAA